MGFPGPIGLTQGQPGGSGFNIQGLASPTTTSGIDTTGIPGPNALTYFPEAGGDQFTRAAAPPQQKPPFFQGGTSPKFGGSHDDYE